MPPKTQSTKEKLISWTLLKLKKKKPKKLLICSVKDNFKRMKRSHRVRENLFAKDTSDKGLLYKTLKEHLKLNNKKMNN